MPLLEKAIARDPDYARAHAALAALYMSARANTWSEQLGLTKNDHVIGCPLCTVLPVPGG